MIKKILISATILCLGVIYISPFFMSGDNNEYTDKLNKDAVKQFNEYIAKYPYEDWDNDGLTNGEEIDNNTDPFNPDTDADGLGDAYDDAPTKFNSDLCDNMKEALSSKNATYENPFISEDGKITMWADDIKSRTYGKAILSQAGDDTAYVFDNFTGRIRIPEGKHAYRLHNEYREDLKYDSKEDLYYVEDGYKIILVDDEDDYYYQVSLFGNNQYVAPNIFTKFVNAILPDTGLISCKKVVDYDTQLNIKGSVFVSDLHLLDYDYSNLSRYSRNNNKLSDLSDVYSNIRNNSAVAVSLIDDNGETIGLIEGYDKYGNLFVIDAETYKSLGKIYISEHKRTVKLSDDETIDYNYFSFEGLGYNSDNNARISFFAALY